MNCDKNKETGRPSTPDSRTDRLWLRFPAPSLAGEVAEFLRRNRGSFAPWEPARRDSYFELGTVEGRLRGQAVEMEAGRSFAFYLSLAGEEGIIGEAALTNIVGEPFLSAFLGYKLDAEQSGRGYMGEALAWLVDHAFAVLGLHRIEANVMPRNGRSIRLLERLGFEAEGVSPKYLKIAGHWEDHIHYVRRNADLE